MLKLTIPEGIDRPVQIKHGRDMEPGKSYLCANRLVGSLLLSQYRCKIRGRIYPLRTLLKVENWPNGHKYPVCKRVPKGDWNNTDVWLVRGGGYGDLLAMTPLIKEIHKRWKDCRIHVACGIQFHDLFYGLPVECELLPIPFDPELMILNFEELIEGHPDAENFHIIDLFAKRTGLELTDRKMHYEVRLDEFNEAVLKYPKRYIGRVAVQLMASAWYRTYPKIVDTVIELAKDYEVLIFGTPGQVQIKPWPNVINTMDDKLDFRQSAAVLSTCDVCLAPDSVFVHLCAALDIPCVALYGPMPSRLRVSSEKTHGIDGTAPCAPCFFHADRADEFPPGKPCEKEGKCIALDAIPVETVVSEVQGILKSRL